MKKVMLQEPINLLQKFDLFDEIWTPKVIAEMNDYQFKLARFENDFVWHSHAETDEVFLVLEGRLRIEFRKGHVNLEAGEMYVVPKGVEHLPRTIKPAKVLLVEPCGVMNTGNKTCNATAKNDVWI